MALINFKIHLKNFENKLSQIYKISNPIERIPSQADKRMMGYILNIEILGKDDTPYKSLTKH